MARHGFPSSGFAGGITPNQERLRAYDAAVSAPQKEEIAQSKLDLARQKEAFDEAAKTSAAEQRAVAAENKGSLDQKRIDSLQAERDAREAAREATQAQTDLKNQHTVRVAEAATNIFKTLGTLDRSAPDFQSKLYGALADNAAAADHPAVMKAVEHELSVFDAQQSLKAKAASMNPTQAFQDSLAASQPIYGVADTNGKNFNATTAGKDAQTHVQVTYLPPGAKQPVTQVLPRTVFDSAVSASQARQQQAASAPVAGASVSPDSTASPVAAAVVPATPAIPQAHIDYLIQNPDTADQFESKYGKGASASYLQRRE